MEQLTYGTIINLIKKIESDISSNDKCKELNNDTDLIDSGIIDSLTMIELVTMLEDDYDVVIDVDDLFPDNFRTIVSIYDVCVRSRKK